MVFQSHKKTQFPVPEIITHGHELPLNEIYIKLKTDATKGLTESEVEHRLKQFGPNVVETKRPSLWQIYLAPLFDTLIVIYLIMTLFLVILAIWNSQILSQVLFWFGIIFFNMILAVFQQFRAQKKLEALNKLSPLETKIYRDGLYSKIPSSEIVPGDIISLTLGDKIPADSRLISSNNLMVNESSLTGESLPVTKTHDGSSVLDISTPISDHKNMVYLGTFVQSGDGKAVVLRTGSMTEIGKIAKGMNEMQTMEIPLRARVNQLGRKLGFVMVLFLFISIFFKFYSRLRAGTELTSYIIAKDISQSIITAMSVMPINIPLLTTIVLITGVLQLASARVIVKELSVVETLGRTSVLCSDKTGTMTTSKMSVVRLWDTENYYAVLWRSSSILHVIDETMMKDASELEQFMLTDMDLIVPDSALELLLTASVLNNDATLMINELYGEHEFTSWEAIGNATDGALLALAYRTKLRDSAMKARYLVRSEYPFDSSVKRMTKLFFDMKDQDYMIFTKGASEIILELSSKIGNEGTVRPFDVAKKGQIKSTIDAYANLGYRVVSIAYRSINNVPTNFRSLEEERAWMESDLTYIGFVCLLDPPRAGVKEAVAKLDAAGIFPIMITGDAPTTAATIASQVGILDPDEIVVEGKDINNLSDEEFFKVSVFARVSPQDKQIIVDRYQRRGDIVAMTGDGVNDSLAISLADAGVAMGITGSEVSKEAADIILADDSYISLVGGIEEGRSLYEKIRMIIFFFIAVNIGEGLVYFLSSFLTDFFLLNNLQRAYIFTILHGITPLIIIIDRKARDTMELMPRQHDSIINQNLAIAMFIMAFSISAVLSFSYFIGYESILAVTPSNLLGIYPKITSDIESLYPHSLAQAKARTLLLTTVYLAESIIIFSIRRINMPYFASVRESSVKIFILVLMAPVLHFYLMYHADAQLWLFTSFGVDLEIMALTVLDLVVVIVLACIPTLLLELYKHFNRKNGRQF